VKFVLTHVAVSTTIPGTKNRSQLEHNVAASILPPLTCDELAAIREALATA
jgi:aryl-alcohol dehydrogenase-like predicted oxidoreductase